MTDRAFLRYSAISLLTSGLTIASLIVFSVFVVDLPHFLRLIVITLLCTLRVLGEGFEITFKDDHLIHYSFVSKNSCVHESRDSDCLSMD